MLVKLVLFVLLIYSISGSANPFSQTTDGLARRALVIGNSKYKFLPELDNPGNDAQDVSNTLTALGFTVDTQINATQEKMEDAINRFGQHLSAGGIGLFYFAGHGVQADGINYLIPINADLKRQKDLRYKAVNIGQLLDEMDEARNGLNIVILDACRNNPLKGFRSASRGLAKVSAPRGTLVAFATSPGSVAADGSERNGTYTKHLLKQLKKPGLSVEQMFKRVLQGVYQETDGAQLPWVSSSFTGDFYFVAPGAEVTIVQSPKASPLKEGVSTSLNNNEQLELSFWNSIVDSQQVTDYRSYLETFPKGHFAGLAKNRIQRLTTDQKDSIENIEDKGSDINARRFMEYFNKGKLYLYDKQRADKAIEYFKKAVQYKVADADMLYEMGTAYLEMKNYPEAIVSFKKTIKLRADYTKAYKLLAKSYLALGDETKAEYYRAKGNE